jgi:hypothetical protein
MKNIIYLTDDDQSKDEEREKKKLINACFFKLVVTVDVLFRATNQIKINICSEVNVENL